MDNKENCASVLSSNGMKNEPFQPYAATGAPPTGD